MTVQNLGVLNVSSTKRSYGICSKIANTTVTNTGTIIANVYGISLDGKNSHIVNKGTIKDGGIAFSNGTFENHGDVISSYTPVSLGSAPITQDVHISNFGQIVSTNTSLPEIDVWGGSLTLDDTYRLILDGDPDAAAFSLDSGATLQLNNTHLIVDSGEDFQDGAKYKIFKAKYSGTHLIEGDWGNITTDSPDYAVAYFHNDEDDKFDDEVSLTYAPQGSSSNVSAEVVELSVMNAVNVVQNRMATNAMMQSLAQTMYAENESPVMVADARTTATDIGGGVLPEDKGKYDVFAMPYGSWSKSTRSPMGYEATVGGLTFGWEYQNNNTVLGIHGGYGRAGIDFNGSGYTRNSEDQDLFTLGVHAGKLWGKWLLSGSITPYLTLHDYKGMTGVNLTDREKADYESFGSVDRILGGYQFVYDDNIFMPTLGLTHIWIHRDRYTTKVTGGTGTTYNTLDDHELQVNAGLRWMRNIECDGFTLVPSVYAGLRQTLTDGSTSTTQSVPGATPVTVNSKSDLTAANLEAFVSMIKGDWTFQLGYAGEMSDQNQDHGAWLRAKWAF